MINVLWIEDFGGGEITATVDSLFKGTFGGNQPEKTIPKLSKQLEANGIFLRTNFQDGLNFIKKASHTVDLIILDIDLKTHGNGCELEPATLTTLKNHYDLENQDDEKQLNISLSQLKQCAGYHLYVELILNQQYPKDKIIFCSNHGENLASINSAFKSAMMEMPVIYKKSDSQVIEEVKAACFKNHYGTLRRAIIDGCEILQKKIANPDIQFNHLLKDENKRMSVSDLKNYLNLLASLLPLQEPSAEDKYNLYKLFIRTLSHEWERDLNFAKAGKNRELSAFMNIMKNSRNWITHSSIFDHVSEEDVAFLFICNMRAFFELSKNLEPFEHKLLQTLRGEDPLKSPNPLQLPKLKKGLLKQYRELSNNYRRYKYNIASFSDLLRDYQRKRLDSFPNELLNRLYQLFWFETSPGEIKTSSDSKELIYCRNIQLDSHCSRHLVTT